MKLKLKAVLIGGFVGLQLLAVAVILASSYLSSERVLIGHARTIMDNLVTYIIHRSEDYLAPARDAAQLTERLANHQIVSSANQSQMEHYFYEQLALHGYLAGLYYANTDGDFLYAMRNAGRSPNGYRTKIISRDQDQQRSTQLIWKDARMQTVLSEDDPDDRYDPRQRPWYQMAMAERGLIWTAPYVFFTSQRPGITTASPVFNADGSLAGVVGVDIEIGAISRFLAALKVGENGRAFILGRNGEVIAFPEVRKIRYRDRNDGSFRLAHIGEIDDPLSRKAFAALGRGERDLELEKAEFSSFEHQGKRYHALFAPFSNPQWPWVIGVYVPEDDFLGPIKQNREHNTYIALLIALLASLVGLWLARNLGGTLRAIRAEALAISGIDLETTFDKRSFVTEVQETGDAFTQMKQGLESYKQRNDELTEDLRRKAASLQDKENRLRATFSSLINFSDALLILDDECRIRFINTAAQRLLGLKAQEARGKSPPFACELGELTEVVLPGPIGDRTAELAVVEIEWEGRRARLASLRDVTERKRAERSLAYSHRRLQNKVDELQRRESQLTAINKMAELFHVCGSEAEVLRVVSDTLPQLFPVTAGAVYISDPARNILQRNHRWGREPEPIGFFGPSKCWAMKQGRPHLVHPGVAALRCEHANTARTAPIETLCLPLSGRTGQLGMIHLRQVATKDEDALSLNWYKDYGVMVAEHIALALNNARLQEDLQYLAIHDPLTGLHNRRYLQDMFDREIGRAERHRQPIGVIIMDVDFFKQTNDRFGHDAGDTVLVRLAAILRDHTRSTDVLCRFGGEEFLLLMTGSGYEDSLARAEALRETMHRERFYHQGHDLGPITLSFGVAAWPEDGKDVDSAIKAADNALYVAKNSGRDRICGARGESV